MTTVRIFFKKCGEAAYISLLDLQRVFQRLLKQSGLPIWYTQGFNPHIYLSFCNPLSLGQESLCESFDVKTQEQVVNCSVWPGVLQPYMPRGIDLYKAAPAVHKTNEICAARYAVTMPAAAVTVLDAYNAAETAPVQKKTKRAEKTIDLKAFLPSLAPVWQDQNLVVTLTLPCQADGDSVNPALLLSYLGALGEQHGISIEPWQCRILRTGLLLQDGRDFC